MKVNMKVNAKGVVILNAVKDLEGTYGKILHCVQDDRRIVSTIQCLPLKYIVEHKYYSCTFLNQNIHYAYPFSNQLLTQLRIK